MRDDDHDDDSMKTYPHIIAATGRDVNTCEWNGKCGALYLQQPVFFGPPSVGG